ncbi:hypothetical protein [Lysinibacillus xylanilyticus]|uniref:hypothetical protein n=1 Tax=Lysinibacillus xylanilyticus TaxID=582475 RepID=UPI00083C947E|nr:hypothetical protein [Lysinibacillus xylanilyticus]
MGISNRGTKAKNITSCDNAFVTNIGAAAVAALSHKKHLLARDPVAKRSGSSDAPQEALLCAKAKRQRQMFYLCESEASATNVLSVRKRSVSNKCFL